MELTFDEALGRLGLNKDQLREYVKSGKLQAFAKVVDGKKQVVFKEKDLENIKMVHETAEPVALESHEDFDLQLDLGDHSAAWELEISDKPPVLEFEDPVESPESKPEALQNSIDDDLTLNLDGGDLDLGGEGETAKAKGKRDATLDLPESSSGSDTISFDIDDADDPTLSVSDTLSLSGEDETLSLEDDGLLDDGANEELGFADESVSSTKTLSSRAPSVSGSLAAVPTTKIVNEPRLGIGWPIVAFFTFAAIVYTGYVIWGVVRVDGPVTWVVSTDPESHYYKITELVKTRFFYPTSE